MVRPFGASCMILIYLSVVIASAVVFFLVGLALIGRQRLPSAWAAFGAAVGMAMSFILCRFEIRSDWEGNDWIQFSWVLLWQDVPLEYLELYNPLLVFTAALLTGALYAAVGAVVAYAVSRLVR